MTLPHGILLLALITAPTLASSGAPKDDNKLVSNEVIENKAFLTNVMLNGDFSDKTFSVENLVKANTDFAFSLQKNLEEDKGNQFFSPYSISAAFAMVYAGANGQTAKQMEQALNFPSDPHLLARALSDLNEQLTAHLTPPSNKFTLANGIWVEQSFAFSPRFLNILSNDYHAKIAEADFVDNAVGAQQQINHWVKQKTNNKIQSIIADNMLDAQTKMVLVNAIYFNSDWLKPFKKQYTQQKNFYIDGQQTVKVAMMQQRGRFSIAQNNEAKLISLPYKGGRFSMLVLLPNDSNKINELQQQLTITKLNELRSTMVSTDVELSLPKFNLETNYNLVPYMQDLGMKDAFTMRADFSKMTDSKGLYISSVIHKAFIEVDEAGTEAAAVTAILVGKTSIPQYMIFNANRPFLFFIQDNRSQSILFMGRLNLPNSQ